MATLAWQLQLQGFDWTVIVGDAMADHSYRMAKA